MLFTETSEVGIELDGFLATDVKVILIGLAVKKLLLIFPKTLPEVLGVIPEETVTVLPLAVVPLPLYYHMHK